MLPEHRAKIITIKNNEASEYYTNYVIPSWNKANIFPEKFDAITPSTLLKEVRFSKYSTGKKYVNLGIKAEITPTEKAVFCSHYSLWWDCIKDNTPYLIMEHDSFLEKPENLFYEKEYGIIFYDKGAMGSYLLQPWFAKLLVEPIYMRHIILDSGPYWYVDAVGRKHLNKHFVVNDRHYRFNPASNQVMSKKYGNTIEHFCNSHPEYWSPEDFHKFIEID